MPRRHDATTALLVTLLAQVPSPATVADQAARLIARDRVTFEQAAGMADSLRAVLDGVADADMRGRVSLLWVQAMRRALGEVPLTAERDREPFTGWLTRHDRDIVYSEPAGQWLVAPDVLWAMHDRIRETTSAEPLAWEAVDNGLPGECEGYPPCYLSGFTMLHGRYLEMHPEGTHAERAAEQILESLEQIERLLNEPNGHELFDAKTGCEDLTNSAAVLVAQLKPVDAKYGLSTEIEKLTRRCPQ